MSDSFLVAVAARASDASVPFVKKLPSPKSIMCHDLESPCKTPLQISILSDLV